MITVNMGKELKHELAENHFELSIHVSILSNNEQTLIIVKVKCYITKHASACIARQSLIRLFLFVQKNRMLQRTLQRPKFFLKKRSFFLVGGVGKRNE